MEPEVKNVITEEFQLSIVDTIKSAIRDVLGLKEKELQVTGFKTFGSDDNYWVAYYTNNAKDRDEQWFSEKSHDDYIGQLSDGQYPYPELWYYHEPIVSGKAFWIDRLGHTMIAVGSFDDTPVGRGMRSFYAKAKGLGVSHGFFYPRSALVDGVFHKYATFEISPLPADVASNTYTTFISAEDVKAMAVSEKTRTQLVNVLGEDAVKAIFDGAEAKNKAMEAAQVKFKAVTDDPVEQRFKSLEERFDKVLDALAVIALSAAAPAKPATADSKAKKPAEGSAKEEADESDDEAAAEGDKPKKKKEVDQGNKEMIGVMTKMVDTLLAVKSGIDGIAAQFNNAEPASRSQYTVVPPDDNAMAALAMKMNGNGGSKQTAPGSIPEQTTENYMATVFGPGMFGPKQ